MEKKLRKEDLNRQDKVHKAGDYREAFIGVTRFKSSPKYLAKFRAELSYKEDLIRRYYTCAYCSSYGTSYYIFQFRVSFNDFATRNRLDPTKPQVRSLFDQLRQMANKDFDSIKKSIRNAKVIWDYDNQGNWGPKIKIKPSLKCDDVSPRTEEDELHIKRLVGDNK